MVDALGQTTAGPVVLGPNTCLDLPEGASFEFVEIRARSPAEHRAWLQILDDTMLRDSLIPGFSRGPARTEMEISLSGECLEPGAGLQVTVSPLTPPIQPQPRVSEWIELYDKKVISREELRHQLALATANAISTTTIDERRAQPASMPAAREDSPVEANQRAAQPATA